MPRKGGGISLIQYTGNNIYTCFLGQFFFKFSWKKFVMGKNIVVPCVDVKMVAFFPRNIHWSSLFAQKACVNTERVPPGHPTILLKSTKLKYGPCIGKKVYYIVLHFIVKLKLQLTLIGFMSVDDFFVCWSYNITGLYMCACVVYLLFIGCWHSRNPWSFIRRKKHDRNAG